MLKYADFLCINFNCSPQSPVSNSAVFHALGRWEYEDDLLCIPMQLCMLASRDIPSGQAQVNPLGSVTLRRQR